MVTHPHPKHQPLKDKATQRKQKSKLQSNDLCQPLQFLLEKIVLEISSFFSTYFYIYQIINEYNSSTLVTKNINSQPTSISCPTEATTFNFQLIILIFIHLSYS